MFFFETRIIPDSKKKKKTRKPEPLEGICVNFKSETSLNKFQLFFQQPKQVFLVQVFPGTDFLILNFFDFFKIHCRVQVLLFAVHIDKDSSFCGVHPQHFFQNSTNLITTRKGCLSRTKKFIPFFDSQQLKQKDNQLLPADDRTKHLIEFVVANDVI